MSNEVSQFFQQILYSEPVRKMAKFALKVRLALFVAILCLIGVYLFLSLLSYSELDVAWSHARGVNFQNSEPLVANIGGRLGAWVADILHLFFGVGAWAILLWLMHEIYCAAYKRPTLLLFRVIAYLFLWVCIGILLYAYAANDGVQLALNFAGIVGYECYTALTMLLGHIGTVLFALFGFVAVTLLLVDWQRLYYWHNLQLRTPAPKNDVSTQSQTDDNPINGAFSYQTHELPPQTTTNEPSLAQDEPKPVQTSLLSNFLNKSGLRDFIRQDKSQPLESEPVHLPPQQFEEVKAVPPAPKPIKPRKKMTLVTDYGEGLVSERVIPEKSVMLNGKLSDKSAIKTDVPVSDKGFDSESFVNLSLHTGTPKAIHSNTQTLNAKPSPKTEPAPSVESNWTAQNPFPSFEHLTAPAPQSDNQIDNLTDNVANLTNNIGYNVVNNVANATTNHTKTDDQSTGTTNSFVAQSADDVNQPALSSLDNADYQSSNSPQTGTVLKVEKEIHWRDLVQPTNAILPQTMSQETQGVPPTTTPDSSEPANNQATTPKPNADLENNPQSLAMQTAAYRQSLSPIPSLELLDLQINEQAGYTQEQLVQLAQLLEIKLKEFGVVAQVMNVIQGPIVTSFEVQLAAGVKVSKVTGISQDLARSLSMPSLRVVEVIAGKPYIGIEIPNRYKQTVKLIELLSTAEYQDPALQIALAMGKDIGGQPVIADLAKAPHMLVAGTTGSGKSVLVNAMLLSMLLKYTPDELRLILIDPKMLELSPYADIPHLLTPVVTDMTEATSALSWCVGEMERRYQLMSLLKVRKLSEFNDKVRQAEQSGQPILDPLWRPTDSVSVTSAPKLKPLPLIVVVADEFADMIMQVGKPAEELITRLAQKSRASGIHLMLATQRPSVDVITGLIKANIPSRVGLLVKTKVDSRTILDAGGAEEMLGNGDMLFLAPGKNEPIRVHGAFVSNSEVDRVANAWRERGFPDYIDTVATSSFETGDSRGTNSTGEDEYYDKAVAVVIETGKTSISFLQRRLGIGYNRAANLVEAMERQGILSPADSTGKRQLL